MNKLLLGLALICSIPAHAEHRPLTLDAMNRVGALSTADSAGVAYYGGPVLSHVKVNVVYWGTGVAPETQTQLETFYRGIVNSTYLDGISEYATNLRAVDGRQGTGQTIGRGSLAGATTI